MINPRRAVLAGLAASLLTLGLASVLLHAGVAADGTTPPTDSYAADLLPPVVQSDSLEPSSDSSSRISFELRSTKNEDGVWGSHNLSEELSLLESVPGRFWDEAPNSPSVAIAEVNGQEVISVSPGPEDLVNVILELKKAPVGFLMARLAESPSVDTEGASAIVREYHDHLVESHATLVANAKQEGIAFRPTRYYSHAFNGIAGSVRAGDLDTLSSLPRVKRVHRDYQVHVNLGESVPLIGAPQIWYLEDEQGESVTGHGIVVAIIDTGIDYTHPDLGGCFGPGCRVIGGYDFINDDSDPMDDMGHGTHVAGIVGASGVSTGVAPDVSFLAYKVLNESGFGSFSGIIEAIERATDPDGDPTTDDGADVINLSLGGPGDPDDPLSQAVDTAVDLGVTVAIAAGNSGPGYSTVGSPGVARKPISVAATDKDDQIASFSSRGPIPGEWNIKPDLAAPGVSILAPVPALGVLGDPSRYLHLSPNPPKDGV